MTYPWAFAASVFMALSVALGAFGAHALKAKLTTEMLNVFEVGVRYQVYHALGLFVVAWLAQPSMGLRESFINTAGWLFIVGILLFSGSLYGLSLSGIRWMGAITPLGGLCFIAGWVALALAAWPKFR
jgi:uncharacterized membrane protein YgdD (TMEM256/DUF423 family)